MKYKKNILFLSLSNNTNIEDDESIYGSVIGYLVKNGYKVYTISPIERRFKEKTSIHKKGNYVVLKVRTGNIQKTNIIEKGVSTLLIEHKFIYAIKKYLKNIKFDMVLYSTPPITFSNVVKFIKKRDNAVTYLMLKDIFPQNAVDIKLLSKRNPIYYFFRKKEKELYTISDKIGCMSEKNINYVLDNNSYLEKDKIELFPNTITPCDAKKRNIDLNIEYRKKYNIPIDSRVFIYGGNLGKPQGIEFVIECLESAKKYSNVYFVICGRGTEFYKVEKYMKKNNPRNLLLLNGLEKEEYSRFLNIGDIGLIFLDSKFTIPNFPSRTLSYMQKGIPILACVDKNTDIGSIVEKNGFGWSCLSDDVTYFEKKMKEINLLDNNEIEMMGKKGYEFLLKNYNSKNAFKRLEEVIKNES